MRRLVISITVSILGTQCLNAASLDPKLDEICMPSPVMPGSRGKVDPRKLMGQLLKTQAIHDVDLDISGRDILFDRKIEAVVNYAGYCEKYKSCSKDAAKKLNEANTALLGFLIRYSRPLPPGRNGYEVTPGIGPESNDSTLLGFLTGSTRALQVACVAGAPVVASSPEEPTDKQSDTLLSRVMIRKKVEDLKFPRTDPKFKAAERASVSFDDNRVKQTTTWSAEAVIGLPIGTDPFGPYSNLVAFSTYKAQHVSTNAPTSPPNIGNIGAGVSADSTFPVLGYYQNLQVYLHFLHSYVTNSDLVTGNVVFTPDFQFPGVGLAYNPFGWPVSFLLKPQAKLVYGNVLNTGSNLNLLTTNDYARAGPRVEFWLFGESGLLKSFSFMASYEYLKVFRGPLDAIWRFETSLNYTFPDQEYWSVQLKYVNGYDLDTLDRQQQVTLGLGVKY